MEIAALDVWVKQIAEEQHLPNLAAAYCPPKTQSPTIASQQLAIQTPLIVGIPFLDLTFWKNDHKTSIFGVGDEIELSLVGLYNVLGNAETLS